MPLSMNRKILLSARAFYAGGASCHKVKVQVFRRMLPLNIRSYKKALNRYPFRARAIKTLPDSLTAENTRISSFIQTLLLVPEFHRVSHKTRLTDLPSIFQIHRSIHLISQVADFTASRELHPTLKNFLLNFPHYKSFLLFLQSPL